eukprot:44845-Ditylum_brightwellii.AAC.1
MTSILDIHDNIHDNNNNDKAMSFDPDDIDENSNNAKVTITGANIGKIDPILIDKTMTSIYGNDDSKAMSFDPDENVLLLDVSNPPFLIDKNLHATAISALPELATPTTVDNSSQANVDCTFAPAASSVSVDHTTADDGNDKEEEQ